VAFSLSGVATASLEPARLVVHLQGGSDSGLAAEHHVRVSLNGVEVGEATFGGKRAHRMEVVVAASQLREGQNELAVTNAGDTGVTSLVFLDRFEVSYPQASTVRDGVFEGVWGEGGAVEVGGLTGVPVILRDSGLAGPEGSTVRWVAGFQATPGSVRFQAEAGDRYVVVTPEGLLLPRIGRIPLSTLRRRTRRLPVIAPRGCWGAAPGAASAGVCFPGVSFEEIASQFNARLIGGAIRFQITPGSWQRPSPRYVLLKDSTLTRGVRATSGPPLSVDEDELSVDSVGPGARGG
jgi:hypothetical protein